MQMNERGTAAFLLLAPEASRRTEWKTQLERYGAVRVCRTPESAKKELEKGNRSWFAMIVDSDADGRATHRLLTAMRRAHPSVPALLMTEDPPRSTKTLDELGVRWLPRSAAAAEQRYFLGYALALEHTGNPLVAATVESLGRRYTLTVKQMQLTALSTTDISRDALIEGLGVSHNTVKTRVRQLLRIHREETMDTLGKKVLRDALSHATVTGFLMPHSIVGDAPIRERRATGRAAARQAS